MKCPDIAPLVPRFFDGELDGAHMRTVALHITRCADCEDDLRMLEKLQDLVAAQAAADVERIDTDSIWDAVSAQIEVIPQPWSRRLRTWWEDSEFLSPVAAWPAIAAAAAVLIGVNLWSTNSVGPVGPHLVRPFVPEIAKKVAIVSQERLSDGNIDNSAVFESIVGGVDSLMIEPKSGTAVLWIDDSGGFR